MVLPGQNFWKNKIIFTVALFEDIKKAQYRAKNLNIELKISA